MINIPFQPEFRYNIFVRCSHVGADHELLSPWEILPEVDATFTDAERFKISQNIDEINRLIESDFDSLLEDDSDLAELAHRILSGFVLPETATGLMIGYHYGWRLVDPQTGMSTDWVVLEEEADYQALIDQFGITHARDQQASL